MQFADRLNNVETSAIRELFKLLGKPGIISFAGGFPDAAMFDVDGVQAAANAALKEEPGAALQYGATEGYQPFREQIVGLMAAKGVQSLTPDQLIVTTGSQQGLDLLGKTLVSPGDKVIVEGPTFLATIQCFRLYGAEVISAPTDENGVIPEALEQLIAEHQPKLVYLIPTFGNPSGAMLSLERRKAVLEMAVKHNTLIVEDDPYGDLYFGDAPPPSLLNLSASVPGSRELLVHCGSLSKVLSPGLRVGWMVAPADLLAKATMCKQFSDAHTSTFAQATAAQYLKSGAMPATLAHVRLTGAGGKVADGNVLAKSAIEKGVAFVPGTPFFCANPDNATLRLSFATVGVDKIREGVARLGQALGIEEAGRWIAAGQRDHAGAREIGKQLAYRRPDRLGKHGGKGGQCAVLTHAATPDSSARTWALDCCSEASYKAISSCTLAPSAPSKTCCAAWAWYCFCSSPPRLDWKMPAALTGRKSSYTSGSYWMNPASIKADSSDVSGVPALPVRKYRKYASPWSCNAA